MHSLANMTKRKKRNESSEARLNGVLKGDDAHTEQRRLESEARTAAIKQEMARERGELMDRKKQISLMAGQIQAAKRKYELGGRWHPVIQTRWPRLKFIGRGPVRKYGSPARRSFQRSASACSAATRR